MDTRTLTKKQIGAITTAFLLALAVANGFLLFAGSPPAPHNQYQPPQAGEFIPAAASAPAPRREIATIPSAPAPPAPLWTDSAECANIHTAAVVIGQADKLVREQYPRATTGSEQIQWYEDKQEYIVTGVVYNPTWPGMVERMTYVGTFRFRGIDSNGVSRFTTTGVTVF